jgi:hypothetical protein
MDPYVLHSGFYRFRGQLETGDKKEKHDEYGAENGIGVEQNSQVRHQKAENQRCYDAEHKPILFEKRYHGIPRCCVVVFQLYGL